jgi:diguanylate cyclase (GGDEF)-like protein/PAS domain S-box-containing protein
VSGAEQPSRTVDLLGEAVGSSSDCVFLVELDSTIVAANTATAAWLGLSEPALLGRHLHDLADVSPTAARNAELLSGLPQFLPMIYATGTAFCEDEMSFFAADGTIRFASTRMDPVTLDGRPPRMLCTFRFLEGRRAIFRASSVGMARLTPSGAVMQANHAFERLVGLPEDELAGQDVEGLVAPEHADAWRAAVARTAEGAPESVTEQRLGGARGVWTRCTLTVVPGVTDLDGFLLSVWEDISDRRAAEAALQRREDAHRLLAHLGSVAVSAEHEGPFLAQVRDDVQRLLRRRADEQRSAGHHDGAAGGGTTRAEAAPSLSYRHDGTLVVSPPPTTREEADLVHAAGVLARSAVGRLRAERALRHQVLHDPLTGLANRRLLDERLGAVLASARPGSAVAVVFVDLDGFKPVNDGFGHAAGDDVLRQFSVRLRDLADEDGVVCRLGGDEFVLVQRVTGQAGTDHLSALVMAAAEEPFTVAGTQVRLSASAGAATGTAGDTVESLLRAADLLMYQRKQARQQPSAVAGTSRPASPS